MSFDKMNTTLRDELHLQPGDSLALESEGESATLRPVRIRVATQEGTRRLGVPRRQEISTAVTNKVLHDVRAQRDRDILN
jgi:hypothetical protein